MAPDIANARVNEVVSSSDLKNETVFVHKTGVSSKENPAGEQIVDLETSGLYNIYIRNDNRHHHIITPISSPGRDRINWNPRRIKRLGLYDVFHHNMVEDAAVNTYFVHKPTLRFHDPPRTLRRGPFKTSPAICLINNSWFWRKWTLQFGDQLSETGVLDPRGVVSSQFGAEKQTNDYQVRGYKVRSWRLWGESGKMYHKQVIEQGQSPLIDYKGSPSPGSEVLIDEVIYFSWTSPLTRTPRHYHFAYSGLDFYWKGTGTVKESKTCGFWLRYNHLKLCVRLPIDEISNLTPVKSAKPWASILTRSTSRPRGFREVCLAKYTSAFANKKAGVLQIYDDVLYRLVSNGDISVDPEKRRSLEKDGVAGVKKLRLYDVIMATALCMVIGEWQKRDTLRKLLELAGHASGAA